MKTTILCISGLTSLICWYQIIKSDDSLLTKLTVAIVALIPLFGPIWYFMIFHNMPSVKPIEEQAYMSHRLTMFKSRNFDPCISADDNETSGKEMTSNTYQAPGGQGVESSSREKD